MLVEKAMFQMGKMYLLRSPVQGTTQGTTQGSDPGKQGHPFWGLDRIFSGAATKEKAKKSWCH